MFVKYYITPGAPLGENTRSIDKGKALDSVKRSIDTMKAFD